MKSLTKITQDNRLIRASYYMTLAEKRVVLLAIGKAQKGKFTGLKISVEEYRKVFGETKQAYRDLRNAAKTLYDRSISSLEGRDTLTRWVSEVEFNEGQNFIRINFSREIEPYLFDLKRCFTSYHIDKIRAVKSSYSIRLYELLMQFKGTGELYITLENLKKAFGVQDKYTLYADFKSRCITPALKELKTKSDYNVKFKEVKKGRKVNGFCFYFEQKKQGEFKF